MPSVLNEQEYNQVYRILSSHTANNDDIIHAIERTVLPKLHQRDSFLDIGPGTGFITNAIRPHFQTCSVIEPSEEFCNHFKTLGYETEASTLQNANLSRQYDYVLCSHVLYNVELPEWPAFLDKMIALIKPGSIGTIVMSAARGSHHEMSKSLNLVQKTSAPVIDYLRDNNINYMVDHAVSRYPVENLAAMYTLCRFALLEDCFTAEQYAKLTAAAQQDLDYEIKAYAARLLREDGHYQLDADTDYIHIIN